MSNSFGSRSGLTKCWAWSAIHVYNVSHSFDPDQAQQNKVCHHHLYPNCVKFSHSFGTRSGPTNIRPDLGPNKQRLSADSKKKNTQSHTTRTIWAATWDFQRCGMWDQQRLRPACAYAQSDQCLKICYSLEYSMTVKLPTEHHLEFLSLKRGLTVLIWVYTCENATLLENTCSGLYKAWSGSKLFAEITVLFVLFFWFDSLRPLNNLSVMRDGSSWVEPVLS